MKGMTPLGRTTAVVIALVTVLLALPWLRGTNLGLPDLPSLPGPPQDSATPDPQPTAITARAHGRGPWTVRGYGYEFTVVRVSHEIGPFGPNEGRRCLRVVARVERVTEDDHRGMKVTVFDDRGRLLGLDPFSNRGTFEPPMHRRTEAQVLAVPQEGGARTLSFNLRGAFWPDGKDLFLEDVPVPR
ncbi:hypothetical protein [Streptomyces sp. Ag109_G2-15]|uniref:hypothetical protein n=1 Tax=Streptomyces sp. Ag109_G2-15 TaxID=1938850 RepID=UPI000BCED107|nr:hypothetical protein [Streptomyces sp. Ag109_G2-15]SOD81390.1 hypothetical protein SAMN06272765_0235 [Streptomyces sp. Ag109_G2-15]